MADWIPDKPSANGDWVPDSKPKIKSTNQVKAVSPVPVFKTRSTKGILYDDAAEPFRLVSEAGSGLLNLPAKVYKGFKGLGAMAGTLAGGGNFDQALNSGTEAIGDRNPVRSPLSPSQFSRAIGSVVEPTVNGLSSLTGQPELVNGLVEAGGDIASLLAFKPSLNALAQPGKVVKAAAGNLKAKGAPFSDKRNTYHAAQTFNDAMQHSDVAANVNSMRQTQTNALLDRLTPTAPAIGQTPGRVPVHPTPGQASGNYQSAALEQSLTAKDPLFAEQLKFNDAQLNKAALGNLTTKLGSAKDLPTIKPAETTGANIKGAIKRSMEPVLSKEAQMWGDVPKYPMPSNNTTQAFADALKTPSTSQKIIKSIHKIFKSTPNTVEGLQTIEREISSAMKAGTDTDRHFLGKIKTGIRADFDAMGDAAVNGDVALHEGKIVYPSKLQGELATIEERIAAEKAKSATPDVAAMRKHLMDNGDSSAMQQVGEQTNHYQARIIKSYEKSTGKPALTVAGESKTLTELATSKEALVNQLSELTPAEDVAQKYAAAKKFSKEEKFDRFYEGTVREITKPGSKLPNESAGDRLFTPTESNRLVKAIGHEAAAEQMMPHVIEQLVSKTVDANSGVMNVPRAMAFVRQNASALENLGLTKSVNQTIKGQIPRAIEAELEARGVDVMGSPAITSMQAAKLIKKYGPAVEKMYGARGMQALTDYGQMMEVIGRNKYVSYSKGSNTVEKAGGMVERIATLGAVGIGKGWIFSATKNIIKGMMGPASKYSHAQVEAVLKRALMDPEVAKVMMEIAKAGKGVDVKAVAVQALKPFMLGTGKAIAAGAVKAATTPPEENLTSPDEILNELGADETQQLRQWKTIGSDE